MAEEFENELENEELEDVEEYTEDEPVEGPDTEEEEEIEEEEEESITDEEDPDIPIAYVADDGSTKQVSLKYSQLGELYKDYEKAHQILQQYNTYYNQTVPLIEAVKNSQLLQTVIYYKAQGYTDEQIYDWLKQQPSPTNTTTNEPQNFEDEIANIVARELDKRIKPIEQQTQQMQTTAYLEEVSQHNNKLLNEAMQEVGLTNIDNADLKRLGEFLSDMYPGIDLRFLKLTKSAAKALMQLLRHEKQQTKQKISQSAALTKKVAKLPKLLGSESMQPTKKKLSGDKLEIGKPLKLEDRIKLKQSLWR